MIDGDRRSSREQSVVRFFMVVNSEEGRGGGESCEYRGHPVGCSPLDASHAHQLFGGIQEAGFNHIRATNQ